MKRDQNVVLSSKRQNRMGLVSFKANPLSVGIAILFAAGFASSVLAQTVPAQQKTEEVVITGSRIRGVAPVGSPVISLGREQMEIAGAANTNDFLRQIPSVTNYGADDSLAGGTAVQNSILNISLARSINLRGLGTASTLTLINGHRIAPGGPNAAFIDADSVPAAAVQRMEVVADGASAIYGSDAVAGVVNMVLRKSFEGAESTVRYGKADGTSQWLASHIFGKAWETGGFMVALEKSRRNALAAKDRPDLYNDNLTPYGGAPGSFQSIPGNVTAAGVNYGVPAGQNGQNFTLGQLRNTSNFRSVWEGREVTPRQDRDTVVFTIEQELTSSFSGYLEAIASNRKFEIISGAGNGVNLSIPATNPFSPCFAGKPTANAFGITCAGNLTVPYSFGSDVGLNRQTGSSKVWDVTAGLKFSIAGDWKGEASVTRSQDKELRDSFNTVNNNAVTVVTQGTATYKGVTTVKPANVPYLNPFCDGNLFACNDPATINYIRGFLNQGSVYDLTDYNIKADGSVFSLPGGNVRLAVGAQYHADEMANFNNNNTAGNTVGEYIQFPTLKKRDVTSYFFEAYIPIVGPQNASPWMRRLDLSIAGRAERYSDFGNTRNPKLGFTWVPINGLEFSGTYGTSFRAPTLCDINPDCTSRFVNAPPLTAAQLTSIANGSSSTVGIAGNKNYILSGGGSPGLQPEKAKTYSLGFNIRPAFLEGVDLNVSYYRIKYTNRIDTPGEAIPAVSILSNPAAYQQLVNLNPTYFPLQAVNNPAAKTQAEFNSLLNSIAISPILTSSLVQANVLGIVNGNRLNTGTVDTNGFDFTAYYSWKNTLGTWRAGGTGTYVNSYKTSVAPQVAITEKVNKFTNPLRFKVRTELGWRGNSWNATGFLNYSNSYNIETAFLPTVTNPSNYLQISSYTTADLTVNYSTGKQQSTGLLNNIRLTLNIQNVFDRKPPFVLNGSNLLFDPQNGNATGRYISMQVTKNW